MPTILFPSPVFGPIKSRRLGASLGINLLPADGKLCNFDCIYCECGFNSSSRPHQALPTRRDVAQKLEKRLLELRNSGEALDAITFAGNGEPTSHPDFPDIVDDVVTLRNMYAPKAKICVLTNATNILKLRVFAALLKTDEPLLKLDAASAAYVKLVDRPTSHYDIEKIIETMKNFAGRCAIQTMFIKGEWQGISIDNTTDEYVLPWLEAVRAIKPMVVTIYTLDRDTPTSSIRKAEPETLGQIALKVRALGIPATVSC